MAQVSIDCAVLGGALAAPTSHCLAIMGIVQHFWTIPSSPQSARRRLDGDDLTNEEGLACELLCAKLLTMQGV